MGNFVKCFCEVSEQLHVCLVIGRAFWQCHGTLSAAEYRMTFPSENHAACCEVYVYVCTA